MRSRNTNIIKWYEYTMKNENEEENLENDENVLEEENVSDESIDSDENSEAVDYGDADPELIESIMAKFRDAKQSPVDELFGASDNQVANEEMSEEDLIASICAPKQNNVDAFVKKAHE